MYAADNPIEPILPLGGPEGLPWLRDLLQRLRGARRSAPPAAASA